MMGARIRIGDFARLAQVTVRTLRHYEDEGLLHPVHTDRRTRYRYYDASQLLTLQRLVVLRGLGVSIPEIREVLCRKDGGAALLRAHRLRLRKAIRDDSARLNQLDALLTRMETPADDRLFALRVRSVPAVPVLCRRARVSSLGAPVTNLFESLEAAASGARSDASPFLLFHTQPGSGAGLDVEACIPVRRGTRLPDVRTIEGVSSACCLVYEGAYSQTEFLYQELLRWVELTGASSAGPLREVYHRFGADQVRYRLPPHRLTRDPASYVTELQVPIVTSTG